MQMKGEDWREKAIDNENLNAGRYSRRASLGAVGGARGTLPTR